MPRAECYLRLRCLQLSLFRAMRPQRPGITFLSRDTAPCHRARCVHLLQCWHQQVRWASSISRHNICFDRDDWALFLISFLCVANQRAPTRGGVTSCCYRSHHREFLPVPCFYLLPVPCLYLGGLHLNYLFMYRHVQSFSHVVLVITSSPSPMTYCPLFFSSSRPLAKIG